MSKDINVSGLQNYGNCCLGKTLEVTTNSG